MFNFCRTCAFPFSFLLHTVLRFPNLTNNHKRPRKLGPVFILTSQKKKLRLREGKWLQGLGHVSAKDMLGELRRAAIPLWASVSSPSPPEQADLQGTFSNCLPFSLPKVAAMRCVKKMPPCVLGQALGSRGCLREGASHTALERGGDPQQPQGQPPRLHTEEPLAHHTSTFWGKGS